MLCDEIIDEVMFISRATEGAIPPDFILSQPIRFRKRYSEALQKELEDRKKHLDEQSRSKDTSRNK